MPEPKPVTARRASAVAVHPPHGLLRPFGPHKDAASTQSVQPDGIVAKPTPRPHQPPPPPPPPPPPEEPPEKPEPPREGAVEALETALARPAPMRLPKSDAEKAWRP